jgi:POT family proton-dependent oligopeptide transporter
MTISNSRLVGGVSHASEFLGHPRGLAYLFTTEMWERFSYYGMRALLVLYMTKQLLLPGHAEGVIGLETLKGIFESAFGPMGVQPFSSQLYGLYTGLVYLTPFFGGILADRVLGQHQTIIIGASLMAAGHFMMAFEPLFLFALTLLILGNGCFKPNMSAQIGSLYAPGDPRLDRAYSIFYVGINLGAFLAPLVCGTLGEEVGWHYGFGAAGVGMTIALVIYLYALHSAALPPDELHRRRLARAPRQPPTGYAPHQFGDPRGAPRTGQDERRRNEWHAIIALLILFLPNTLFWATYEQQGNTIVLFADDFTDRTINLIIWHGEIPVTWFQAVNPFMIFAFTPFVITLWARQALRGTEPSSVTKMALGCFGVALANLIMIGAVWQADGAPDASWLWLLGYFTVLTIGELYLSPVGLSLVSKVTPARMVSMMMGVWLGTSFIGNFLAGWLGSFWSSMDKTEFFLMIAGIAAFAGIVILGFRHSLGGALKD